MLFPSHPALANLFAPVGFCLLVFFSIWFFIDFLKVRQQYPRLYWIFVADMAMAVLGLCGLVFDFYVEVAPVLVGCSLFIIPLCTFIAWHSSEFGIFGSRWVAVGYSSYYLLISLNLFEALGLIPGHNFIVYGWQYGATLYVVFLVSGVLTRIREMERSRDLALAMSAAAEAKVEIANAKHREKNTFLNLMAHELKTPLASIDAATQVLAYMAQQAPDSAVARRHDRIRAAVARLNTLVEDSLNMAKGNVELTQEQSLRRKNCDMDVFLNSIREGYVSEKSLKISTEGVDEFYGDQAQLRLAIHNLLDNAVKYGCCNEAIILTVKRLGIGDQPGIEFSVSSGITKTMDEDCELWFNKGWRGKHATEIDGMGLGLPLVREIAELHGGIAYCRLEDGNPQFADRYFVVAIWIPVRGLNGEGR